MICPMRSSIDYLWPHCQKFSSLLPLCRRTPFDPKSEQHRTIVDKRIFQFPENYPDPWPYKEKGFHINYVAIDKTKERLHTNSKLIVVEGNIGSGKSQFATELAHHLGFHYIPPFTMENVLIDRYGNDLRKFYHLFPKSFRVPDELMFYQNPSDDNTARMQDVIYLSRWEQHLNALAHILNTGQGVVLERSAYSDFVFVNAMREKDWISPEFFKFYYFIRKISIQKLKLWPHLFIYLHSPISKCLENIKKRGNKHEIAAVDESYLKTIEESYKDLLREARRHSYILSYDWTEPEHMDTVLDDIYALNMDYFDWHAGEVLESWNDIGDDFQYGVWRSHCTQKKEWTERTFMDFEPLRTEIAELVYYPPDIAHWRNVMQHEVLKMPYVYGYASTDGYKGVTDVDSDRLVPEMWYEYFYKDCFYDIMDGPFRFWDPYGKDYDPDYLHPHH